MARGWAGSTCYRRPARLMSGGECYDVALASFNQRQYVLAPARQRCLHGALVGRSVVDTGRAGAVATVMVEDGLDHVWLNSDVGHAGGDGPADVVQPPGLLRLAETMIECRPTMIPAGEAA